MGDEPIWSAAACRRFICASLLAHSPAVHSVLRALLEVWSAAASHRDQSGSKLPHSKFILRFNTRPIQQPTQFSHP